ncbi:MAG: hypothetical protein ACOCYG_06780, partial [Spirochaetota bacterium]
MQRSESSSWVRPVGAVLFAVAVGALAVPAAVAQMDWMPQVLRDIPPELEQGIPEEMTYREYRMLNRNVDFFTMAMSMLVPGYGLFEVERPWAGAAIATGRVTGYGLTAAGVLRQWSDLRDVWDLRSLDPVEYERVRNNLALAGAGAFLNMAGWGLDVLWAFHVADRDKDFVRYKYGLRKSLESDAEGRSLRYIEALRDQGAERIRADYHAAMVGHLATFPYGSTQAAVDYLLAEYHVHRRDAVKAVVHAARAVILRPDPTVDPQAQELLAALLSDNEARWEQDWMQALAAVAMTAGDRDARPADRHLSLIRVLVQGPHRAFREEALFEMRRILEAQAEIEQEERIPPEELLATLAEVHGALGDTAAQRRVYAVILDFHPDGAAAAAARER